MRFRDIAAFVLQHATFPHPTPVCPKFPHVPLGIGGWHLGYKDVGLIVCAISFHDFQLIWTWSTNVTDRRMDRVHGISVPNFAL